MADRNPDNPELAVDELKRKARRRLVGAVVLALAAAVLLCWRRSRVRWAKTSR